MNMMQTAISNIQQILGEHSMSWLGIAAIVLILVCCMIGYRRGFLKEILSAAYIFLALGIVWLVNPYVNDFLREHTPIYHTVQEGANAFMEEKLDLGKVLDSVDQEQAIEQLNLPGIVTEQLVANNTAAVYQQLGVSNFYDYISNYLAGLVVNGASFLLSYLLAYILLRILGFLLDVFSKIPVIHGANKLAGAILGGGKCIVYIWIAMLLVNVLSSTSVGEEGLRLIGEDPILKYLYENNLLSSIFAGIG